MGASCSCALARAINHQALLTWIQLHALMPLSPLLSSYSSTQKLNELAPIPARKPATSYTQPQLHPRREPSSFSTLSPQQQAKPSRATEKLVHRATIAKPPNTRGAWRALPSQWSSPRLSSAFSPGVPMTTVPRKSGPTANGQRATGQQSCKPLSRKPKRQGPGRGWCADKCRRGDRTR